MRLSAAIQRTRLANPSADRRSANEPYHIIQTLLILDKREELLDQLAQWTQWKDNERLATPFGRVNGLNVKYLTELARRSS